MWRKKVVRVKTPMIENEIIEVFVRVQEPTYYDRIIFLIGVKFFEIVKVGETIEDGLKTGKIARVVSSPESSGLLKKKREDLSLVSYEERTTSRKPSSYQGRPRNSNNSYQAYYTQGGYQNFPPPIYQNSTSTYQNVPTPNCKNPSTVYKNPPPLYQIPSPINQNVSPNCANVQSN